MTFTKTSSPLAGVTRRIGKMGGIAVVTTMVATTANAQPFDAKPGVSTVIAGKVEINRTYICSPAGFGQKSRCYLR